jgi:hypothetical protein
MQQEVTHKEIYDRLVAVETKVDRIETNTDDVVTAFKAAQGAFIVLDWLARAAKPLLWLGACIAALSVVWEQIKVR